MFPKIRVTTKAQPPARCQLAEVWAESKARQTYRTVRLPHGMPPLKNTEGRLTLSVDVPEREARKPLGFSLPWGSPIFEP